MDPFGQKMELVTSHESSGEPLSPVSATSQGAGSRLVLDNGPETTHPGLTLPQRPGIRRVAVHFSQSAISSC